MTQEQWDSMSSEEKCLYLTGFNAEVSSQAAIDGNSRVGDNSGCFIVYSIRRGSVLTGQSKSLLEAAKQDAKICGLLTSDNT